MLIVIAHQCLGSANDTFLGVSKGVRDSELLIDEDNVRRPVVEVVEFVPDSQQKIVGLIELASFGVVDELVFDEFTGGLDAFFEKANPEKILIVTQATAAVFDVRFLHVHRSPVFCVAVGLILDALRDVLVFKTFHASVNECLSKALEEFGVPDHETRFEEGSF